MDEELNKDINLQENSEKTSEQKTLDLFQKEQDLLNTMNPEFSSSAKEEFDEMKSKYEKAKSRNKSGLDKKLDKLKIEFSKDIKGLEKISNYSNIENYEIFKKLIISNSLGNGLEERVFKIFEKKSSEQIRKGIGYSFPVDSTGIKKMVGNIEKGVDIKRITLKNNISKDLSNINKGNAGSIKEKIKEYLKEYGQDEFAIQGLISINDFEEDIIKAEKEKTKIVKKETETEKKETETEKKETETEKELEKINKKYAEKNDDKLESEIKLKKKKINNIIGVLKKNNVIHLFPNSDKVIENLEKIDSFAGFNKNSEVNDEKLKNISKLTNETMKIVNNMDRKSIEAIFANLRKKVEEDKKKLVESGVDVNSEEGMRKVYALGSVKNYNQSYREFKKFSGILGQRITSFGIEPIKPTLNPPLTSIEKWQMKNAGISLENYKRDGDNIYQPMEDDIGKLADLTKIPPEIFLVTDNGYKLNTKLPKVPDDLILEREELSKKIIDNNQEISDLTKTFNNRLKNYNEKKSKGENTNELETKMSEIKKKIKELKNDNKKLENTFISKMNIYNEKVRTEQEEKERKQKETLKFLSKIGFDLVPQYITKQLIENINFAPKTYGFDAKIDLENGDLGIRGFGDDYMSSEYKDEFMKIFIKAIGNPQMDGKNIFNENNINNGANVIDSSKLDLYLNTNGYKGFGAFGKMRDNLKKSKQENPN